MSLVVLLGCGLAVETLVIGRLFVELWRTYRDDGTIESAEAWLHGE